MNFGLVEKEEELNVPSIRLPSISNCAEKQTPTEPIEPDTFPSFVFVFLVWWDAPEPAGLEIR